MKTVKIVILMVLVIMIAAGMVFAVQQEASVDKGKVLFNDPNLGTNGKTCNTCHRDGNGLENAAAKTNLNEMISSCIIGSLKGRAMETNSVEVRSLALYIKSLVEKKPATTKKAPVGC